ncbi:aa3-type cytochrome c oxidase subunit IV [Phenylobacterium immobile]|uniref:aa3-type cytochrome c oxidase subunit IV n=1 Tax=Phenylobacterium immobile TaxID=21 RepID=UPI000ABC43BC|nr:aa3-type cytochrome c oxidase subunit IV [Phenylobacterium immobile]
MASEYHRGEMDIQEQASTYDLFGGMTKWGSLALAALLALLVLWFCTPAGFLTGFVVAVIVAVVGFVILRGKPAH